MPVFYKRLYMVLDLPKLHPNHDQGGDYWNGTQYFNPVNVPYLGGLAPGCTPVWGIPAR